MKILFINPASYTPSFYSNQYPPLGIGYLMSACKEAGHIIDYLELGLTEHTLEEITTYIKHSAPDYCSFTLYTTNLFNTYKIIEEVKNKCNCKIVVGGPHATVLSQQTLLECPSIDYLVKGEGELTLIELLTGKELHNIPGLHWRSGKEIISNIPRPLIKNLDVIPFPEREIFKKYNYSYDNLTKNIPAATIIAGRGCPYNCIFCASKAVWGNSFRIRSPENVIEEIEEIIKTGITEFYFEDDLFTFKSEWIKHFCNLIISKKLNITWKALSRVDTITTTELKLMKKAGCHTLQFGVESGSDTILKSIKKGITTTKIKNTFDLTKKAGLNTFAFFMFGHPQDTHETIQETINFSKELNSDFVAFFLAVPFPGTKIYNLLSEPDNCNWLNFGVLHENVPPLSICNLTPEELLKYEESVYKEYFLRTTYLKNIIVFRALTILKIKNVGINILEVSPKFIKSIVTYGYNKLKRCGT